MSEQIREYNERIEGLAQERYPQVALLKQIKGVGMLIALTFVLTLEDPHRFGKSRDVGCYLGLQPGRRELRVYFQNANGLRAGAPVRLAGVEVGRITSVRARPEMQAAPAEVTMRLRTPYELHIPNDATVSLDTAGVWGETYAEINVTGAFGAPVKSGGILQEKPTKILSTEDLIEKLGDIVQRKPCAPQGKDVATVGTPKTRPLDHP